MTRSDIMKEANRIAKKQTGTRSERLSKGLKQAWYKAKTRGISDMDVFYYGVKNNKWDSWSEYRRISSKAIEVVSDEACNQPAIDIEINNAIEYLKSFTKNIAV